MVQLPGRLGVFDRIRTDRFRIGRVNIKLRIGQVNIKLKCWFAGSFPVSITVRLFVEMFATIRTNMRHGSTMNTFMNFKVAFLVESAITEIAFIELFFVMNFLMVD